MAFTGNATCNTFKYGLINGQFKFDGTQSYKIALYTNEATLDQNTTAYTSTGEASGGSYVAGGATLTPTVSTSGSTSFVTFTNVAWNGAITARGALIYKESGPAVCVLDFGADKTSVLTFQVQFPPASADSAIIRLS